MSLRGSNSSVCTLNVFDPGSNPSSGEFLIWMKKHDVAFSCCMSTHREKDLA